MNSLYINKQFEAFLDSLFADSGMDAKVSVQRVDLESRKIYCKLRTSLDDIKYTSSKYRKFSPGEKQQFIEDLEETMKDKLPGNVEEFHVSKLPTASNPRLEFSLIFTVPGGIQESRLSRTVSRAGSISKHAAVAMYDLAASIADAWYCFLTDSFDDDDFDY